ncbi:MAG TPA: DUF2946 family protein [Rhodoferax sp.]|nr:DUF2946 family protein [Rhodoferax sp.]
MPFRVARASAARPSWVLWLALWLALFGALAPTVSHALTWANGDREPLIEICTSAGPRWTALSTASEPTPSEPTTAAALDRCPFCLLMADRLAPPPQPQALLFAATGHASELVSPPMVFLSVQVLAAAHPRGPPAL